MFLRTEENQLSRPGEYHCAHPRCVSHAWHMAARICRRAARTGSPRRPGPQAACSSGARARSRPSPGSWAGGGLSQMYACGPLLMRACVDLGKFCERMCVRSTHVITCICMCVYACKRTRVHVRSYAYAAYAYVRARERAHVCIQVRVHVNPPVCVCTCKYVFAYISVCTCISV